MANINITGTGTFAANNYNVPNPVANQSTVSFHSANATSVVCFDNYATFDMWGVTVPQGQQTDLTLKNVQATGFTCNPSGTNCPQSKSPKAGPGYTITMGGNVPKGHHKS